MDSNDKYINYRKKRVKRLKTVIVAVTLTFVLIPNVLCVYFIAKLNEIDDCLLMLNDKIENVENKEIKITQTEVLKEDEIPFINNKEQVIYRTQSDKEAYPDYQRIYLTFDDGPGIYTNEILDVLDEYNAKATFFVVEKDGYDDVLQRIVYDGNTLGIHSATHVYSDIYSSPEKFEIDVDSVYNFTSEVVGEAPKFYRFPGGSSNTIYRGDKQNLIEILDNKGLKYYDWNVSGNDAVIGGLSKDQIANNVIKGIGNKEDAFVLLHDASDKGSTADALRIILDTYKNKENVIFLPITEYTEPCEHVKRK